jgi:hypothetical protein
MEMPTDFTIITSQTAQAALLPRTCLKPGLSKSSLNATAFRPECLDIMASLAGMILPTYQ